MQFCKFILPLSLFALVFAQTPVGSSGSGEGGSGAGGDQGALTAAVSSSMTTSTTSGMQKPRRHSWSWTHSGLPVVLATSSKATTAPSPGASKASAGHMMIPHLTIAGFFAALCTGGVLLV